jgi:hypothetical protein
MSENMLLVAALGLQMPPGRRYEATFANGLRVSTPARTYMTHAVRVGQTWGFVRGGAVAVANMKDGCARDNSPEHDAEVVEAVLVADQAASAVDMVIAPPSVRWAFLPWRKS